MKSDELDAIFRELHSYLDEMDESREKILPAQRKAVRICSEIIKHVHRKEFEAVSEKIPIAQGKFAEMKDILKEAPGTFPKDYILIVQQELGEAIIFAELITKNRFPTAAECQIDTLSYAYALTDVVGELRRHVLTCIRNEDLDEALKGLALMDEIYSRLFTLDYPGGLVPGLRKKTDMARNIIAKTEGDVTISINILKLNKRLKESKWRLWNYR